MFPLPGIRYDEGAMNWGDSMREASKSKPEDKDPARQAGSTAPQSNSGEGQQVYAADLTVREQEEELPLPVGEQPVACVGQPIEYDFSADLKLRDEVMDELLELSQAAPNIEEPVVSIERRMESYDPVLDLRMIEGEEIAGAASITRSVMAGDEDLITRSVMPTQQDADLDWQQVEAEFCKGEEAGAAGLHHAERDHSWPHAPREVICAGSAQNLESSSAPSGFHHAERDANYAERDGCRREDDIAAAISKQLAAVSGTISCRKSPFSKFRAKRHADGGATAARKLAWVASLEMWLVLASLSLVFQIFPTAFWNLLAIADVRNWPWAVWVGVEVAVIAVLLALKVRQTADA